MTERRIRVDTELMEKIKNLTKDTDAKTHSERMRWIVNRVTQLEYLLQQGQVNGITKKDLEAFRLDLEKWIADLGRGY